LPARAGFLNAQERAKKKIIVFSRYFRAAVYLLFQVPEKSSLQILMRADYVVD
jgi:hypothetical protein